MLTRIATPRFSPPHTVPDAGPPETESQLTYFAETFEHRETKEERYQTIARVEAAFRASRDRT